MRESIKMIEGKNNELLNSIDELSQLLKESGIKTTGLVDEPLKKRVVDLFDTILVLREENNDEFDQLLEAYESMIHSMVNLDFSQRLPFIENPHPRNFMNHVFVSLNILSEELQYLSVSKKLLEQVVDTVPDTYAITTDDSLKINFISKALASELGTREDFVIGQPAEQLILNFPQLKEKLRKEGTLNNEYILLRSFSDSTAPVHHNCYGSLSLAQKGVGNLVFILKLNSTRENPHAELENKISKVQAETNNTLSKIKQLTS